MSDSTDSITTTPRTTTPISPTPNTTTTTTETPISTTPNSNSIRIPPRPSQSRIEQTYNQAIETLAQCDQDYCEDADFKYHSGLLYYVLKQAQDEWEPILTLQVQDDELGMEKYLPKAFHRYDADENVQKSLNQYRLKRWRNPLINYDARQWRSPLYYRGAGDLWRRLHQVHGRPTVLQCLDFALPYHKLRKQYEHHPDHRRLTRQFTLSTFDHKACIPGLQCPGLRPFLMWCMHNPAASPQQVEECISTLPLIKECSKPGYEPPERSMERSPKYIIESTSGPSRKKLRAGRKLRAWLNKADEITGARPPPPNPNDIPLTRNERRQVLIQDDQLDQVMQDYPRYDDNLANPPSFSRPKVPRQYDRQLDQRDEYAPLVGRRIPTYDHDSDDFNDNGNNGDHDDSYDHRRDINDHQRWDDNYNDDDDDDDDDTHTGKFVSSKDYLTSIMHQDDGDDYYTDNSISGV